MLLNNRHGSVDSHAYRYGFNGMERDDEVSDEGNSYTAEFWQYDPRLARRWNIDPVVVAHESPYAAFRNNPIFLNDPDGDCPDCDENAPNAEVGDIHVSTDIKPFKAPNGYAVSGTDGTGLSVFASEDVASITWIYMGKEAGWQALGFETKGGKRYAWDSDKMWYADPTGKEFDDHVSFDVTNWGGDAVKPAVQAFVENHTKGDAFHSFKKAYHESGSSLTSFIWDGIINVANEVTAGGHRSTMALGSLYSGYLMTGGPVGIGATGEIFSGIGTFNKGGFAGLRLGSLYLGYSGVKNPISGMSFRYVTRSGRQIGLDYHNFPNAANPILKRWHGHYAQKGIFSLRNHIDVKSFVKEVGWKEVFRLMRKGFDEKGYGKTSVYKSLQNNKF